MTDNDFDYSKFENTPTSMMAGDNSLHMLQALAEEQIAAELKVAQLEEQLEEAKAELKTIKAERFPALMDELDMAEYTTKSGQKIKVQEKVVASVNKDDKEAVNKWVEDQGDGDLIKREVTVVFTKDQEDWAAKFLRDCAQRKKPLDIKVSRAIHHATFTKYIENMMAAGKTPHDKVHVIRHRTTEISG